VCHGGILDILNLGLTFERLDLHRILDMPRDEAIEEIEIEAEAVLLTELETKIAIVLRRTNTFYKRIHLSYIMQSFLFKPDQDVYDINEAYRDILTHAESSKYMDTVLCYIDALLLKEQLGDLAVVM
jgi:hypothetical protein